MPLNIADYTFKQYPAKEQSELKVRINIPVARGSMGWQAPIERPCTRRRRTRL